MTLSCVLSYTLADVDKIRPLIEWWGGWCEGLQLILEEKGLKIFAPFNLSTLSMPEAKSWTFSQARSSMPRWWSRCILTCSRKESTAGCHPLQGMRSNEREEWHSTWCPHPWSCSSRAWCWCSSSVFPGWPRTWATTLLQISRLHTLCLGGVDFCEENSMSDL